MAAPNQFFITDTTAIRGACWGFADDTYGVMVDIGGSFQTWTDSTSVSANAGAYPNSKLAGYVIWNDHNPFFWDTNINLKANHTMP